VDTSGNSVIQRQRQLGQQLAEWRKLGDLNQTELARRVSYDRTTVAHAERGTQIPAEEFWLACDQVLTTGGALLQLYQAVREAKHRKAEEAAARARAERRRRLAGAAAEAASTEPRWVGPVTDIGAPGARQQTLLPYAQRDGILEAGPLPASDMGMVDWPVWFGLRFAHLLSAVDGWPGSGIRYDDQQALLHQEILVFDTAALEDQAVVHSLSRRQALVALAALPLPPAGWQSSGKPAGAQETFLSQCAASLTACWHLLRGSDLDTVEQILSTYSLPLQAIARQRSLHRAAAARLASQAHRISGIVALHRNDVRKRELHCQQALHYARIGSDASTQAAALISLASTYFYSGKPRQAANLYENASVHESIIPRLLQSRLHAEMSVIYGQLGREREALQCLDLAQDRYPDQPELDPSSLYAEFTPASLTLEQGLAYLALAEQYPNRGYQARAKATLDQVDQVDQARATTAPQRIRFEIANQQAAAALLLNDLDSFDAHLTCGMEGAALLRSRQRHHETVTVWQRANKIWPGEPRLALLGGRLRSVATRIAGPS
jgi:transcriptional regulator with XRE-family HTH domain